MNLPGVEDGGNNNSALENKQNFHLGDLQSSTVSQQIDGFSNAFFDLLVQGVMAINAFPTADLTFYTMAYPQLRQPLNETRSDVLQYLNSLLIVADSSPSFYLSPLEGLEDLMDRFDPQIMDVFDGLLEKADTLMDRERFSSSTNTPSSFDTVMPSSITQFSQGKDLAIGNNVPAGPLPKNWKNALHLPKPQLKFIDAIDNSDHPFVPKLKEKLNARVPFKLEKALVTDKLRSYLGDLGMETSIYTHPYDFEIRNIIYPEHALQSRPEIIFQALQKTPFTFIDTENALRQLSYKLDAQKEFAVDLEHHDRRTYQGFTCLMQLSTRDEDFIVDTLELRQHLHILNSSFTNPNIVKVLHGADMDNLWLQRDFGVYIVNLFDTFHASTALELPGRSLAFLLKHYADITVDKKYQRADWRIRPLPADLLNYAQEDTHYLLYIYDRMRNELIELAKSPKTNPSEPVSTLPPLLTVFKKSAETTLKVYMKPVYTPKSYTFTLKRLISKTAISSLEALVFKHLHAWRDRKARELDESTDYVLPNYALLKLTRSLPKTLQQVVRCSGGSYPVLLANRAEALRVIEDAHEEWKAVGDENAKRDLENAAKVPMLIQTQHVRFDDEGREIGLRLDDENLAGPSVAETNILEKDRNENADLEKISDAPEESNCRINAAECQSKPNAVNFATEQHICTGLAKTSAASFSTRPMAIAESSVFWNESSSESGNSEIDNDSEKDGSVADDSRQLMKKIHDSISFAPVPPVVASEQINAQEYSLVVQDDKESEDEEDNITPIILSSIAPPQTQHRKPKERHTAMTNSELAFISLDSKLKEPVKKGNKRNRKSKIEKFGDNDSIRGKDLKELCQSHALTFTESKKEKVRNDVFDPFSEIVVDEKLKKRDRRLTTNVKSGARQLTYKKAK